MPLVIPAQAIANQTLQVQLAGQPVTLAIYQEAFGLFMDVLVNGGVIVAGVICQNINRIVRDLYLNFQGDLIWLDSSGAGNDPTFDGIGSTYQLLYLTEADLAGAG
jgi:hypothetical protein